MNNKALQLLLSNVINNGTVTSLLDSGLDFKDIAELTDFAIDNGFILVDETEIKLSETGISKLYELRKERKNIPKKDWISLEEKSKIRKITKDFIFLPRHDELP